MKFGSLIMGVALSCSVAACSMQPSEEDMQKMIAEMSGLQTEAFVYKNVKLIDVETGLLKEDMSIVVDGDKISAVVATANLEGNVPDGATVVDGSSWYAMPGLIDSHVHLATQADRVTADSLLKRYLYAGITTVRDMGGDIRSLADIKRASLVNEIEAPDVHYSAVFAGPEFFSDPRTVMSGLGEKPGYVPWMQGITDDTDLELAVAKAKGTYASGIKIYANVEGELSQKIMAEAKKQDFPVWTHTVVDPAGPFDSIKGGAKSISHACSIGLYVAMEGITREQVMAGEAELDFSNAGGDNPVIQKILGALSGSDTMLDATLQVYGDAEGGPGGCPRSLAASYVKAAVKAGVKVSAGTDEFSDPDDPFPALHLEIDNLVRLAGMTNAQAIEAATINSAKATAVDDVAGTIEVGKFANMIFMEKNPLEDVANLKSIVMTVKRGHQFKRSDYKHETVSGPGI